MTFPDPYKNNPDLAGQAVVFNVTINSIKVSVVPELSEEFVKEKTDYDSIETYKDGIREKLQTENEKTMLSTKMNNVFTAIIENSEVTFPQNLVDYYAYEMKNSYVQMAKSIWG